MAEMAGAAVEREREHLTGGGVGCAARDQVGDRAAGGQGERTEVGWRGEGVAAKAGGGQYGGGADGERGILRPGEDCLPLVVNGMEVFGLRARGRCEYQSGGEDCEGLVTEKCVEHACNGRVGCVG